MRTTHDVFGNGVLRATSATKLGIENVSRMYVIYGSTTSHIEPDFPG